MRRGTGQNGAALLEFAIVLPVLLAILVGMIEFARYIVIHQKLDKTANAMADFVTQGTSVSCSQLNSFASAANQIMAPYDFSGQIIFSSVAFYNNPIPPCQGQQVACIAWQHGTAGEHASFIGVPGGNATMPGGYQVIQGQNVIVAEAFFDYAPLLTGTSFIVPTLAAHTLYKAAVYKPRQGTLTALDCS